HLDADRALAHLVDEAAHHVEGDVRLEQGPPHLAQRRVDVRGGERPAPGQAGENAAELFRQAVEHLGPCALSHSSPLPGWGRAGGGTRRFKPKRRNPLTPTLSPSGRGRRIQTHLRPRAHRAVGRWPPASTGRSAKRIYGSIESGRNLGRQTGQVKAAQTGQV